MEEKRKSAGDINMDPLQEAVLTPIKKYDISDGEKFAKLLVIIQRDIDPDLSNELSKIDITKGESDKSDLLHKKITNYMLKIVENLYENQLDDYSLMKSTPKFEYEVIIERNKDDTNSVSRNPNTTLMLVGSDKVIRNSVSLSDDSHTKISFPIMDLTGDTVEIKLDNSSEKKATTKLFGLKEKLGRQKMQELEENSVHPFEWFKVSEISIHEAMTKKLQVRMLLKYRLGLKI